MFRNLHICDNLLIIGCMYLMKVANTRDPVTQVHVNYLVSMLEYATIVSADCWDVLIALKPGQRGG